MPESTAEASAAVGDVQVSLRATVEKAGVRCILECDGRTAILVFRENDIDVDVESGGR